MDLRQGREKCRHGRDNSRGCLSSGVECVGNSDGRLHDGAKCSAPNDIPLRDAIAKGVLPGPRIRTANEPLEGRGEATGTSNEIRAYVRKQKQAGADLIKIFASKSIHQGGGMTLSQEQLNAACDEAKKQGLRTLTKRRCA